MKHYVIANRQGTKIRIKPSHKLISQYLEENTLPELDEKTPNAVSFVTKKDLLRICNELKIGYKEYFVKLVNEKNTAGIILGCEEMKKEIVNAQKFFGVNYPPTLRDEWVSRSINMKKDLEDERDSN